MFEAFCNFDFDLKRLEYFSVTGKAVEINRTKAWNFSRNRCRIYESLTHN